MIKPNQFKFPTHTALTIALLLGSSPNAFSHTRLEVPTVAENLRISNNVVIGHGCGDGTNVIAHSVVFPDGVDSIVKVNGAPTTDTIDVYVTNYGNLYQKILNHSVFKDEDEKHDANGNTVGYYTRDGKSPDYYATYVPFRAGAMAIEPASCAKSVKVTLGIADICKITTKAGFAEGIVNLWTPAVGSEYDGPGLHGFNSPATLTVMRDLVNNPMDAAACGDGLDVEVIPSAAQMNRDMPIVNKKGTQIWPKP
ncbi:hypothetical protein C8R34_12328 [Nitrosomonas sp. Nm84]|uniref:hypothetical protein n=1 Tax=Nitrosomonas sp. Nm84 TaxID=200124 RepID=UPI000D7687A5|nr:hypothetical protein [Nitrosomonas sp. Nm84]PXW84939.1 hypothetical protein C8R34_12328 [Nitrosomonas sp. Nm84]